MKLSASELLRSAQDAAAELTSAKPSPHTPNIDVESMLLALSATSGDVDAARALVASAAEMAQTLNATQTLPHRERLTTRHALLAVRATTLRAADEKPEETKGTKAKG